MYCRTLPID
jgi:hypothetical protein